MIDCCSLVLDGTSKSLFKKKWEWAGVNQVRIIREVAELLDDPGKGSGRTGATVIRADVNVMDATFYLETMARFCNTIKAGKTLEESIRELSRSLKGARRLVDMEGVPPHLSGFVDATGSRPAWFEDDDLRHAVAEAAEVIGPEEVKEEIIRRLQAEVGRRRWGGNAVVASGHAEVPDADEMTLVVVPYEAARSKEDFGILLRDLDRALHMTLKSAEGARVNRNSIAFVVANPHAHRLLEKSVRDYLALSAVRLGLFGSVPYTAAAAYAEEADAEVWYMLRRAYSVAVVPSDRCTVERPEYRTIPFDSTNVVDGAIDALEANRHLIRADEGPIEGLEWSSAKLLKVLDYLSGEGRIPDGCISLIDLWKEICTDTGLPRLASQRVLIDSVEQGVVEGSIVYFSSLKSAEREGSLTDAGPQPSNKSIDMGGYIAKAPEASSRSH